MVQPLVCFDLALLYFFFFFFFIRSFFRERNLIQGNGCDRSNNKCIVPWRCHLSGRRNKDRTPRTSILLKLGECASCECIKGAASEYSQVFTAFEPSVTQMHLRDMYACMASLSRKKSQNKTKGLGMFFSLTPICFSPCGLMVQWPGGE